MRDCSRYGADPRAGCAALQLCRMAGWLSLAVVLPAQQGAGSVPAARCAGTQRCFLRWGQEIWEPDAWIYLFWGCTTFLGCAYWQLCPAVVWGDGGSRGAFCQLSVMGQAPGSCSSWLCPPVCFTQGCSSPAPVAGSVCVWVLMLWPHTRS